MTFGRQSLRRPAARRVFGPGFWGLVAALMLLLSVAGCGGGGGSAKPPSDNTGNDATITGKVVEFYSKGALPGATVRVGARATVTDQGGNFSLKVPAGTANQALFVDPPAGTDLYDLGAVQGTKYDTFRTTGFPVPTLASKQELGLGDVTVYSQSGPPPPPSI